MGQKEPRPIRTLTVRATLTRSVETKIGLSQRKKSKSANNSNILNTALVGLHGPVFVRAHHDVTISSAHTAHASQLKRSVGVGNLDSELAKLGYIFCYGELVINDGACDFLYQFLYLTLFIRPAVMWNKIYTLEHYLCSVSPMLHALLVVTGYAIMFNGFSS